MYGEPSAVRVWIAPPSVTRGRGFLWHRSPSDKAEKPMSDTPKTDAFDPPPGDDAVLDWRDFSRSLERHNTELAKALIAIALSPNEDNEWDGVEKFRQCREIAMKALDWSVMPLPQPSRPEKP